MRNILLVLFIIGSSSTFASVDHTTLKCAKFMGFIDASMKGEQGLNQSMAILEMAWLYGYISGENANPIQDSKIFNTLFDNIGNSCRKNHEANILDIARKEWKAIHNN